MLLACVGFVFATVLTWMGSDIAVIPTTMVGALFGVVIGMVVWEDG
jgi:hypothetical protein